MTSASPASNPSNPKDHPPVKAAPSVAATPWTAWRRRWLEPIVVVTIIIAWATTLATGVMAEFRSVKTDIQTSEARLHEEIQTSEIRLREEIQASEARQNKRTDELKTDIRAMNERLDAMNERLGRVLETLPAAKA
ncbi:MAG: hypothetical protein OXC96_09520 [Cyanobacteria bacterium MAG CAR1_bin_15]|nr:hypothetical protein [Cyanobacteria bacterium MAG CAR1_bin_15]